MSGRLVGLIVRLYLIRHGETIANSQGLVLGSDDSPLSPLGLRQASLLRTNPYLEGGLDRFWRLYASSLERTQVTARAAIGEDAKLIIDSRLSELGKGARQGYPKSFSMEQAMEARRREENIATSTAAVLFEVPSLESEEDGWLRIKSWLDDVFADALREVSAMEERLSESMDEAIEAASRVFSVFAVTHSAILRLLLQRLFPNDERITSQERIYIPNTSVTVVELKPNPNQESGWTARLVDLTGTQHLK